ncbi:MAG: hypothetical protein LCH30_00975 [Proteobacteria bacterium]|nr:hypothetical protein [Pseudomonadota bacterium]
MEDTIFLYYMKEFLIKELKEYSKSSKDKDNGAINQGLTLLSNAITKPWLGIPIGRDAEISEKKRSSSSELRDKILALNQSSITGEEKIIKKSDIDHYTDLLNLLDAELLTPEGKEGSYFTSLTLCKSFLIDLYDALKDAELLDIPFAEFKKGSHKEVETRLNQETKPLAIFEFNVAAYFYAKLVAHHKPNWSESLKKLFKELTEQKKNAVIDILKDCKKMVEGHASAPNAEELQLLDVSKSTKLLYLLNADLCKSFGVGGGQEIAASVILATVINFKLPKLSPGGGILEQTLKRLSEILRKLEKEQHAKQEEVKRKETEEKQRLEDEKSSCNPMAFEKAFIAFKEQAYLYKKAEQEQTVGINLLEKTKAVLLAFKKQFEAMPNRQVAISLQQLTDLEVKLENQLQAAKEQQYTENVSAQEVVALLSFLSSSNKSSAPKPSPEIELEPDNTEAMTASSSAKQSDSIASTPNQEPSSSSVAPKPNPEPLPSVGANPSGFHTQGGGKPNAKNGKAKTPQMR